MEWAMMSAPAEVPTPSCSGRRGGDGEPGELGGRWEVKCCAKEEARVRQMQLAMTHTVKVYTLHRGQGGRTELLPLPLVQQVGPYLVY